MKKKEIRTNRFFCDIIKKTMSRACNDIKRQLVELWLTIPEINERRERGRGRERWRERGRGSGVGGGRHG